MKIALLFSVFVVILMTDLVSARSARSLSAASNDRIVRAEEGEEPSQLSRKKKKKGSGESGSGSGSASSESRSGSSESGGKSGSKECVCPSGSTGTSSGTPIRSQTLADRKRKKKKGKKGKKGNKSSDDCSCEETATEIGIITAAPTEIITAGPTRSSVI